MDLVYHLASPLPPPPHNKKCKVEENVSETDSVSVLKQKREKPPAHLWPVKPKCFQSLGLIMKVNSEYDFAALLRKTQNDRKKKTMRDCMTVLFSDRLVDGSINR